MTESNPPNIHSGEKKKNCKREHINYPEMDHHLETKFNMFNISMNKMRSEGVRADFSFSQ